MAFWDFLKDANKEKEVAGKVFNFLKKPVVGAGRTVSNIVRYGPESFVEAVPKVARGTRDFAVGTAREVARIPETAVRSTIQAGVDLAGKIDPNIALQDIDVGAPTPTDPLRRAIYGSEPLQTYQRRGAGIQEATGIPAPLAAFGLVGLDLTPGGKGAKQGIQQGLEALAKATTPQQVRQIMKGTPQDIIDKVAPAIAQTKDPNIIKNIISKASAPSSPAAVAPPPGLVDATVPKPIVRPATPKQPATQISDQTNEGKDLSDFLSKSHDTLPKGSNVKIVYHPAGTQNDISIEGTIKSSYGGKTRNDVQSVTYKGKTDTYNRHVAEGRTLITDSSGNTHIVNNEDIRSVALGSAPVQPDPFTQITDAINGKKGAAEISAQNKAALSQQRGQRFAASKSAGETAEGSQGYFQELSQLKGGYSKTKLGGMVENIGPEQAEELFSQARRQIQAVPDSVYDDLGYFPQSARLNTQTAIRKVIFGEGGGVPTESELKLIRLVSPDLADDIASKIPKQRQFFDWVAKLAGLPRALQASLDLSMGGRQGLLVAARHPILWARANKESVKYINPKYFEKEMSAIRKTPEYALGEKYGLATPAASKGSEEAYASADLAYKIPGVGKGVEASQRAYDGGLTKLRSDLWAQSLKAYGGVEGAEKTLGAKGMEDLALAINTLTGRGGKKGGLIEKHVKTLSTTLFAPRLWAARLQTLNPVYYARLSPAARKVALENAGAFAAVASVVLGAVVALGGEVETDARSSDFLKVKFGDTRYDIFGGLQQNIVFAHRILTGEKKSSTSGDVTKFARGIGDVLTGKSNEEAGVEEGITAPTALSIAGDLFTNKLAPVPGFGVRLAEGKARGGEDINVAEEVAKLFVPINIQGIAETSESTGSVPEGVGRNIPNFFGIGTQTYGIGDLNLSDKKKSEIQLLEQQGASKEQIKSVESFYQHLKAAPKKQSADDKINRILANALFKQGSLSQDDLTKAQKVVDDYNERLAQVMKKWFETNKGQPITEDQASSFESVIIELDETSIERRLQTISENPVKYGG